MIDMDGDKMSKSTGNIITMREFLNNYPGEVFKYLMLSSHYRSRVIVSQNTIHQAISALARIYSSLFKATRLLNQSELKIPDAQYSHAVRPSHKCVEASPGRFHSLESGNPVIKPENPTPIGTKKEQSQTPHQEFEVFLTHTKEEIKEAFNDDFATPRGLAVIFNLVKKFNALTTDSKIKKENLSRCALEFIKFFKNYGEVLSLFQEEPEDFLKSLDNLLLKQKNLSRKQIDHLVNERTKARHQKDFAKADQLRNELTALGIELQDAPQGTSWEVSK